MWFVHCYTRRVVCRCTHKSESAYWALQFFLHFSIPAEEVDRRTKRGYGLMRGRGGDLLAAQEADGGRSCFATLVAHGNTFLINVDS